MDTTGPNKGFIKRVVKNLPSDRRKKVEAWAGICMCHATHPHFRLSVLVISCTTPGLQYVYVYTTDCDYSGTQSADSNAGHAKRQCEGVNAKHIDAIDAHVRLFQWHHWIQACSHPQYTPCRVFDTSPCMCMSIVSGSRVERYATPLVTQAKCRWTEACRVIAYVNRRSQEA